MQVTITGGGSTIKLVPNPIQITITDSNTNTIQNDSLIGCLKENMQLFNAGVNVMTDPDTVFDSISGTITCGFTMTGEVILKATKFEQ